MQIKTCFVYYLLGIHKLLSKKMSYFHNPLKSGNKISKFIDYPCQGILEFGLLKNRYKRFLADVQISDYKAEDGDIVNKDGSLVVHCPNTGPMISLLPECPNTPNPCVVSTDRVPNSKSKRKYRYTLEMVRLDEVWVGIHSALANKIVLNLLNKNLIPELVGFSQIKREVKIGDSKIDFELIWNGDDNTNLSEGNKILNNRRRRVLVEVKSVTLAQKANTDKEENGTTGNDQLIAVFPDCVSERASKHAKCLTKELLSKINSTKNTSNEEVEAYIFFLIQRNDCSSFSISGFQVLTNRLKCPFTFISNCIIM